MIIKTSHNITRYCRFVKANKVYYILYGKYTKNNSEILSDAKSINLSELYNAIIKVEKTDKCPACHTPLKNVVINPFENAKAELDKLKKIEDAKKRL